MFTPEQLKEITNQTLCDYEGNAEDFWQATKDHDVEQNLRAMLDHIRGERPYRILDFGCGPGRDLLRLKSLGHIPVGLDGTALFAQMARQRSGCEVWHQNFIALDLPQVHFDGVFANASLFHVPSQELRRVLGELWDCLKPEGILFSSNPRGDNREGWNAQRYACYYEAQTWQRYGADAGFDEVDRYFRPSDKPPKEQRWMATVWRKVT